jgi:hypothetical protein
MMVASTQTGTFLFRSGRSLHLLTIPMILVHILRDGVILVPPFPAPKISKLLHAGSVRPSDHFWHEGMANWQIVSTRWEADDGSSAAPATTTSPAWPAKASAARLANHDDAPLPSSRRNRTSLIHQSKMRYHETLVPWGQSAATAQAS